MTKHHHPSNKHHSGSHAARHHRHTAQAAAATGATAAGVGIGATFITPEMRQAGVTFAQDVLEKTPKPLLTGLGVGAAIGLGTGFLLGQHHAPATGSFVERVSAQNETISGPRR